MGGLNPSLFLILFMAITCSWKIYTSQKFILDTIPFKNKTSWQIKKIFFILGIFVFLLASLNTFKYGSLKDLRIDSNKPDLFFVIDFTASMRVEDVGGRSRVDSAIDNILDSVKFLNASRFGVSLFSDKEYQLIPLTEDIDFFNDSLISLQNNVTPDGGGSLEQALVEVSIRENNQEDITVVVISDFENINVNEGIVRKFEDKFTLVALPVGTVGGGKIPDKYNKKYFKKKYVRKNGKIVYSYLDDSAVEIFKNRISTGASLVTQLNLFLKEKSKNETDKGWVSPKQRNYGNIIVFVGLVLIFASRAMMIFAKHFFFSVILFSLLNMNAFSFENDLIKKIELGDGEKVDFLLLANQLVAENQYEASHHLYKEQNENLGRLERINYGSLKFMTGDFEQGVKEYIFFLETMEKDGDYETVRENFLALLNNAGGKGGVGKSKSSSKPSGDGKGNTTQKKNKK